MGAAVPYFPPWVPEDDLLLKNAVEAGASLESLAKGAVQFSRRFSIKELRDRWHALLYHPEISAQAAAHMLEVELSASNLPKSNRLFKVKGQELIQEKRKVDNVRNHYYAMRKRICNEPVDFLDPSYHIPQNGQVGFMGSEGSHSQEQINKLIDRNCMEGVPVGDNFGVTEAGFGVGSQDFPPLERVVGPVVHGFHTTGVASLTNDLHAGLVASGCLYGYGGNNLSNVSVENAVGMDIGAFHHDNLGKDITQMLNDNPANLLGIQENNMEQSMEMTDIFADHDLEVKSLPVYGAVDRKNGNNFTGFGESQGFSSVATNCKSPRMLSGYSAPEHSESIWRTLGVLSPSSITNDGICGNKGQTDVTFLKSQMCHMKKIISPELAGMISEPNDAVVTSGNVDDSFAVSHSEFMELSDSLLDYVNEGDLLYMNVDEKDMDRASLDGLSSVLLSSPKDLHQEDSSRTKEPGELTSGDCVQPVDGGYSRQEDTIQPLDSGPTNQLHACDSEVNASSVSVHKFCLPDNMVTASCLINTEDPEIPCNEDIFPSKAHLPHSFSAIRHSSVQTSQSNYASDKEMCSHRIGSDPKLAIIPSDTEGKAYAGSYIPGTSGLSEIGSKDVDHGERLKLENHGSISPSATSMYAGVGGENSKLCSIAPSAPKSAKGVSLQEKDKTLQSATNEMCHVDSFCAEDSVQCPAYGKGYPLDVTNGSKHEANSSFGVASHAMQVSLAEQDTREVPVNGSHEMGCLEHAANLSSSDREEQLFESEEDVPYFSDIETMILDMDLPPSDHDAFFAEEDIRYHQQTNKMDIVKLEKAATSYMQRAATQRGALAVFYGRHSKHYITKPEVSLGRATRDIDVDIDLSGEGPGNRISRRQAVIKMEEDGTFSLTNLGKHVICVNNKDIASGCRLRLGSGSLVEIRGFRFIFETNPKLVKQYISTIVEQKAQNKCTNANINQSV